MTELFFANSSFREYLRLLLGLHHLIAQGEDEGEGGEELRDRLDTVASHLSQAEIDALSEFSADFYSLSDPPNRFVRNPTAQVRAWKRDALALRSQAKFIEVFELLRKLAPYSDPAKLALQRATVWERLDEPVIALAFFNHARKLAPTDDAANYFYLMALSSVRPSEAVAIAEDAMRDDLHAPVGLLLAATFVVLNDVRSAGGEGAEVRLSRIAETLDNLLAGEGSEWLAAIGPGMIPRTYGLAALVHADLDDADAALAYVNAGLSFDMMNELLLTIRGMLRYTRDRPAAVSDLEAADLVRRASGVQNPWPALFLAHAALDSEDYGKCEQFARDAIGIAGDTAVGAKAYELLAIALDYQNRATEDIAKAFGHAVRLDPENDRIRANLEIFRESRGINGTNRPELVRQDSDELRSYGLTHLKLLHHPNLAA